MIETSGHRDTVAGTVGQILVHEPTSRSHWNYSYGHFSDIHVRGLVREPLQLLDGT